MDFQTRPAFKELTKSLQHEIDHFVRQPGIDPDKKRVAHNPVRVLERARNATRDASIPRLLEDVPCEDFPSFDVSGFEPQHQFTSRNAVFYRDGEAKPGRTRAGID